jgi:phthalate 4,5-dioxygenase reductase subunit
MTTLQDSTQLRLVITEKSEVARDIWRFEFRDPEGKNLPPFEAGSNLTVQVPNGAHRRHLFRYPAKQN